MSGGTLEIPAPVPVIISLNTGRNNTVALEERSLSITMQEVP
jgi:hypothetical protein